MHSSFDAATVDHANSFEEAQARLEQRAYDLLLVVHDGPELQAAKVLERLRLSDKKVPVLFLPGNAFDSNADEPIGKTGTGCAPKRRGPEKSRQFEPFSVRWPLGGKRSNAGR